MRVALVSPYSWSYPGGVTRHIASLAAHLREAGHDARILTPFDPDDRRSVRAHRGAAPERRELSDEIVALGRTVGFAANGAVSNLAVAPSAVIALRRELRRGGYDVVHVHEPIAPVIGWDVLRERELPLVGTFHAYSTNRLTNGIGNFAGAARRLNRLAVRIAVSKAAAWTGERFFGGRYRVIPNGVEVPDSLPAHDPVVPSGERPLRLTFIGQAVERKGLPVALAAFEALRGRTSVELDLVGVTSAQLAPLLADSTGVRAHGQLGDAAKIALLRRADLLLAPSLRGESFGMVLTEAFAAGVPVVASKIPGYAGVVSDGVDGVLVPPGDPVALATAILDLAFDPGRRGAMSHAAGLAARRYAWPRVTAKVIEAYEDAIATPAPRGTAARLALRSRDPDAVALPRGRRLPSLEPGARAHRLGARGTLLATLEED